MFHKPKSRPNRSFVWKNPDAAINETKTNRNTSSPFSSTSFSNDKLATSQSNAIHPPKKSSLQIQKPAHKNQEQSDQIQRQTSAIPNSMSTDVLSSNSFLYSPQISSNSNPNLVGMLQRNKLLIHLFVCDNGNTKVKMLTDQFIDLLLKSGIDVFAERYLTHQPGFQVRAVSMQSRADFFFQIHSKTANPGHVRLYLSAQPKRMTITDAVREVWFRWRMLHGTLNEEEVELLSRDKLLTLLKHFANLDFEIINIEECQHQIRDAIILGISTKPVSQKLQEYVSKLEAANTTITNLPIVASTEYVIGEGSMQQSIIPEPITKALSLPLRSLLISIIDQTLQKIKALLELSARYQPQVTFANDQTVSNLNELEIKNEQETYEIAIQDAEPKSTDGSSWGIMVESLDENRVCSMNIASFGDECQSSLDRISTPIFLDDYDL